MRVWVVVIAVGLGSYLMRIVPLLVAGRFTPSARMERGLSRAGTAALTALVLGGLTGAGAWPAVVPAAAAIGVGSALAVRGATMLRVVAAGVAVHVVVSVMCGLALTGG